MIRLPLARGRRRHPACRGARSGRWPLGTIQFSFGALSGLLGGLFTDGSPRGMAALLLAAAIGVAVADRLRPRA